MLILPLLAHEATLAQALLRRHSIEASGCVIYMRDVVDDIHDFIAFCETLSTTPAVSSTCTIIDDIVAFTAGQPHRKKGSITAFKHCSRMRFKKLKKKKRTVTPANAARIREHNLNATKATDIIDFDGESSKRRSAYTEIPHPTCAVPSHPSPTPAPPPTIDFVAWFTPLLPRRGSGKYRVLLPQALLRISFGLTLFKKQARSQSTNAANPALLSSRAVGALCGIHHCHATNCRYAMGHLVVSQQQKFLNSVFNKPIRTDGV